MITNNPYAPVGATVYHRYWDDHYTVISHNENGTVTVYWHGDNKLFGPGGRKTLRTPFDPKWETVITHLETVQA